MLLNHENLWNLFPKSFFLFLVQVHTYESSDLILIISVSKTHLSKMNLIRSKTQNRKFLISSYQTEVRTFYPHKTLGAAINYIAMHWAHAIDIPHIGGVLFLSQCPLALAYWGQFCCRYTHFLVPFLQDKIVQWCPKDGKISGMLSLNSVWCIKGWKHQCTASTDSFHKKVHHRATT